MLMEPLKIPPGSIPPPSPAWILLSLWMLSSCRPMMKPLWSRLFLRRCSTALGAMALLPFPKTRVDRTSTEPWLQGRRHQHLDCLLRGYIPGRYIAITQPHWCCCCSPVLQLTAPGVGLRAHAAQAAKDAFKLEGSIEVMATSPQTLPLSCLHTELQLKPLTERMLGALPWKAPR